MWHRQFILIRTLLLLALILRATIPAGFMPGPQHQLMICPGMEAMKTAGMTMDSMKMDSMKMDSMKMDSSPDHNHDGGSSHAPCAFSAAFACGTTEHAPLITVAVISYKAEVPPLHQHLAGFFPSKSFLSQGPPRVAAAA